MAQRDLFGQLEFEIAGRKAMSLQRIEDDLVEAAAAQLYRKQIDADHRDGDPGRPPDLHLRAGLIEHPTTYLLGHRMLLQRVQEERGGNEAAGRMMPAQERLGAD